MSQRRYHCFYRDRSKGTNEYREFENLTDVLELVRLNHLPDGPMNPVRNLRVIYGELCAFEPVEVVTIWKEKLPPI